MKTLGQKLLDVFEPDEILTLREIARRAGYGNSTVTCYMADLAKSELVWRVAHGKYSLSPRPKGALYTQKERVLAAFRDHSFVTTRYVRIKTGLPAAQVCMLAHKLLREGVLHKIRRGVYSASQGVKPPPRKGRKTSKGGAEVAEGGAEVVKGGVVDPFSS